MLAAGFVAGFVAADTPPLPIPPRAIRMDRPNGMLGEVVAGLVKQTGFAISYPPGAKDETIDALFQGTPFWDALEAVADRTGHRIALSENGRRIALDPRGKCKEVSAVAGPFRVVARQVWARYNLELGQTAYEVQLDAHWEPRFPVFRIDSVPAITKAADDKGTPLTTSPIKASAHPSGFIHTMPVRLGGLTRESRKVAVLAGDFAVTAAPEMLAFRFPDLTAKLPAVGELPGDAAGRVKGRVAASLRRFDFDADTRTWEAELELNYPPDHPAFESFEADWWLSENRLRLVAPGGARSFDVESYETPTVGRKVVAVYRFKEDPAKGLANPKAKGWSLVYETPAPLVEFRVPFELRDIPLP
jgi:hypothetical protein